MRKAIYLLLLILFVSCAEESIPNEAILGITVELICIFGCVIFAIYFSMKNRKKANYWLLTIIGLIILSCIILFHEPADIVKNSAYDSSVIQVEQHLKETLLDPKSYEMIEWSAVQKERDGSFCVRHKYRARNKFGGYIIKNQIFYLDNAGRVYNADDIE